MILIFFFVIFITVKSVYKNLYINKSSDQTNDFNSDDLLQEVEQKINITDELNKLNDLHKSGALSDEEFKAAKNKILSN